LEVSLDINMRLDDKAFLGGAMTAEELRSRQNARATGGLIGLGIVGLTFGGEALLPFLSAEMFVGGATTANMAPRFGAAAMDFTGQFGYHYYSSGSFRGALNSVNYSTVGLSFFNPGQGIGNLMFNGAVGNAFQFSGSGFRYGSLNEIAIGAASDAAANRLLGKPLKQFGLAAASDASFYWSKYSQGFDFSSAYKNTAMRMEFTKFGLNTAATGVDFTTPFFSTWASSATSSTASSTSDVPIMLQGVEGATW
jgi:hypothetical protein